MCSSRFSGSSPTHPARGMLRVDGSRQVPAPKTLIELLLHEGTEIVDPPVLANGLVLLVDQVDEAARWNTETACCRKDRLQVAVRNAKTSGLLGDRGQARRLQDVLQETTSRLLRRDRRGSKERH